MCLIPRIATIDAGISPDGTEVCDGVDNDCMGLDDLDASVVYASSNSL